MESFEQKCKRSYCSQYQDESIVVLGTLGRVFILSTNEFMRCAAMALLELPRGCDYWNDERMRFMVNGTDSTVHEFDGCMYGLKSQFNHVGTAIKKPWRVVSRGVSFSDLHAKCDGSHAHGPCAGKETRATQLYTDKIVKCIIRGS